MLANLKESVPALERLLKDCNDEWVYEDLVYRFYHQSFKVYFLQETTKQIVAALQALAPTLPLNNWFTTIIAEGTGKTFQNEHNQRWLEETRPILEAYFHARYFLAMAVRYARQLENPPRMLPSGWAAFLYLYDLR